MNNFAGRKNLIISALLTLTVFVLGGVTILTASKLFQTKETSIAPTVPQKTPQAAGATAACTKTFTVAETPVLRCDSVTMSPTTTTVTQNSQQASFTANASGGSGTYTYVWTLTSSGSSQGTLSATTGRGPITWTAPNNVTSFTATQTWTIRVTISDGTNTATSDDCRKILTYTPPDVKVCNSTCANSNECPSDLKCISGRCRKESCSDKENCTCDKVCNSTCSNSSECPSDLKCISGRCRKESCSDKENCSCDKVCNDTCNVGSRECPSGLDCISGRCRNSSCSDKENCSCDKKCNDTCNVGSNECPSGLTCYNGRCRNPNVNCRDREDCSCPQVYKHYTCVGPSCSYVECNPNNTRCSDTCSSNVDCQPKATPPEVPQSGFELPTVAAAVGGGLLLLLGLLAL